MDPSDAGYYQEPNYYSSAKVKSGNFVLGGDPNWLGNFAQGQQDVQGQAKDTSREAQYLRQQGGDLKQQGGAVQNRIGGGPSYGQENRVLGQAGQTLEDARKMGQGQGQLAGQLQDFARTAGTGPSAAQAQLGQARNDALASQLAMAKSGGSGGFGESAASLDAASRNAGAQIAGAGNASAQVAAQEEQARRAQQLQAFAQSGQALDSQQQGQFQAAQQAAAMARQYGAQSETASDMALRERGLNDQTMLGLYGQSLDAQQQAMAAESQAQQNQLAAQGLTLNANNAQLGASMNEEQLNAQLYGTDADIYSANLQNQVANRNLDQQFGRDVVGGVGSAISAIGGLAMLSDRRAKRGVRRARLDEVYRALTET